MGAPKISDAEFVRIWRETGSPQKFSNATGLTTRAIYARRARLAAQGHNLSTISDKAQSWGVPLKFERSRKFEIANGYVIIFSDPHFYPDSNDIAQKALITLCKELKPKAVLCGGDALDGTQISRYDPTRGWHQPPSLKEQFGCMVENMNAIKTAAGRGAITAMCLGNHDARLSRYLAMNAPHMEDLPGTRLEDYIPAWPLSWTIELKGVIPIIVRHRNLAGMLHLQAKSAGCHYIHGHLHRLNVHTVAQYGRFIHSVDCGSFADPQSDAFDYTEDGPPHVQGFVVLKFDKSELGWPEIVHVRAGKAWFRGATV